ncbi:DUF664 domain-containing protein [Actinomadura logoneensis]|uniref:DUF664 domain-containing protein n=1 Tax=Actinomadura logoneensis TaxID=2293572 RepID=A0A372JQ44_9ACTN|nr:DUF664 domain-containing protein [Actinomadura logoneensis]RFU41448.1 DUF664 domain-containing protein [Actinomadura logoneensis]
MGDLRGLERLEFAFPGPLRDRLVAAILSGAKTSTTGLLAEYEAGGDPLPEPGRRGVLVDSAERDVAVLETVEVGTVRLADVGWEHARDEGEGHRSVAEWRAAHEDFWHGAEMRAVLGDPDFTVDDDTLVVTERFRVVRTLADHGRYEPARTSGERETLAGFLDWQRATLALKCEGLDADQLRRKALLPSELSLLGLVRHMAQVEHDWFRVVVCGDDRAGLWPRAADGGYTDFHVDDADPDEMFAVWRGECENSRAVVAERDLDQAVRWRDETYSVRWVVTHMIEEYARHNGHADLLREHIDGVTGE